MSKKMIFAKLLGFIPDYIFNKILFRFRLGYWPDFKNPISLNEKINHIKLYSNNPLRKLVADRIKVRDYVKKKAPECDLIEILWVGENFSEEIYLKLPEKFVIKANHGSGMVLVVDKNKLSYNEIYKETEKWKKIDYGKITRQFVYNEVPKTLIVEEFISFEDKVAPDYKFMCVNGDICFIQVDLDRFDEHCKIFYDENFMKINLSENCSKEIEKPKNYDKIKKIVKKLSEDFDFIRVDLYILNDIVYLGELTNTPGNGFSIDIPKSLDLSVGKKIRFEKEFKYDL